MYLRWDHSKYKCLRIHHTGCFIFSSSQTKRFEKFFIYIYYLSRKSRPSKNGTSEVKAFTFSMRMVLCGKEIFMTIESMATFRWLLISYYSLLLLGPILVPMYLSLALAWFNLMTVVFAPVSKHALFHISKMELSKLITHFKTCETIENLSQFWNCFERIFRFQKFNSSMSVGL